jgi:hypothetical protein
VTRYVIRRILQAIPLLLLRNPRVTGADRACLIAERLPNTVLLMGTPYIFTLLGLVLSL